MSIASTTPNAGFKRLNVLFIGAFDSTNYAYVELIHELTARGHTSTVVVENERDVVNNKMFVSAGIPMIAESRFPLSDLDAVDFVFSGPFLRRNDRPLLDAVHERGKFLISFANLFSSVTMRNSPDLVITTSQNKFREFAENGLRYNMVAVGNPQYDPLVRTRIGRPRIELNEIRKVLVVDQGAYPFGELGKSQLARTLINLAENNPAQVFHIKPRYLLEEDGEHLHSVSDHLYDHLRDIPDNMVLIQERTILEEIVLEYDAMITTWSTAHLDAAALGLPLLLIGGLDSVDVFDVRRQRVAAAYEHLQATGCVVDWKDLRTGPCPFNYVSDAYIKAEFSDIETPCAPRVASLLEAVDRAVVQNDLALSGNFQLSYAEFMSCLDELETVSADSEENRLNRRLFTEVNKVAQNLVFDNRCLGFALDMSPMLQFWDLRLGLRATDKDVARAASEARDTGLRLKSDYFASHPDEVEGDEFVQDAYFDWLRQTRDYDTLLAYSGRVVAPSSFEFNRGMAYLRTWRPMKAARRLVESFSLSLQRQCRVLKKDKDIKVLLSRTDSYLLAHAILILMNHHRKYDALGVVDVPYRPNFEGLVYYKMRALVATGQGARAKRLYSDYVAACADAVPMKHGAGLESRVLRLVVSFYRRRLRWYAARLP